ncbi:Cytochrome o ubiquinol oxidase, subunit IV [Acidithiobacillus ferrivorans]|jgi:cytochrome o ubiquinol oxidase operon protein cyoD|uniref:Cytochrome O ubiquinol oxidase n=3 Tax=Acidithiobacillus ferrivorans TaxID=160808 RepID=A0A060UKN1_9PROT|nr:cytochrome o ubiquinol oxidase [Acidithiobacillus ferrivorans]AEM47200.1 cytochrome o ubiquinol oxidase, subunit IV [Acidithiobacillus ferrivorans SS3]OCB02159.1 cytochrome O ubiquinol oxidase [Acidithiobacillus ferrivorans]OFA17505.1 cytochrome O ubiquinol oxidase [Acidithiobacillus ferrivorans]CDQ08926.1 Cytochrome o ubiquinol oxidase, subunit IV [Acidithiobacillus ferrivorans]SMH67464.1 Cytochrome o ubiquinol oxidase, subunit IV [Acidithiobacillus ferrivorans]
MTEHMQNPLNHPEVQLANGRAYLASFIISMLLMTVGLWLAVAHITTPFGTVLMTSFLAGVVVIIQGYFILHMDISHAQMWHTVAMVLFLPLFVVTIGLTAWMFHGLYQRTMIMPPAASSMAHVPSMPH